MDTATVHHRGQADSPPNRTAGVLHPLLACFLPTDLLKAQLAVQFTASHAHSWASLPEGRCPEASPLPPHGPSP